VLAGSLDTGAVAALEQYAAVTGTPGPAAAELAPFHRARELEGAVWSLGMAHQYPARYQQAAGQLLDRVLGAGTWSRCGRDVGGARPGANGGASQADG
jgi:hypothetical protein